MIEFNLKSGDHLSALFFGGNFLVDEQIPDLDELGNHKSYKTGQKKGQLRYKYVKKELFIKGLELKPQRTLKTKKDGVYQTNEYVLKTISKKDNTDAGKIAKLMLRIRELNKQISTYYDGTEKFVHDFDSCVHHELCHFGYDRGNDTFGGGVVTGRLSGQKPNMLNQPKSTENKVRQHFISRFNKKCSHCGGQPENYCHECDCGYEQKGCWISADFSQIEPCTQAELSRDPMLLKEIENGTDKHCLYLALKEHIPYEEVYKKCKIDKDPEWDLKRSKIKGFTFAKAYGAGIKKIAYDTQMTEEEVKDLFQAEKERYPILYRYQDINKRKVEMHGELQTIFGRVLKFKKYPAPQWLQEKGILESYKPQEIINWPVQSVGSADLTLIMIGWFWRHKAIYNRHIKCDKCDIYGVSGIVDCVQCHGKGYYDNYLMINTVYDSLDVDCRPEFVDQLKEDLKVLTNVKEMCYTYFKYIWEVPVKIDIKEGNSWYEVGL